MLSADFTDAAGIALQMTKITAEETNNWTKKVTISFISNESNTHFCIQHTLAKSYVDSEDFQDRCVREYIDTVELNCPRPSRISKAKLNMRCIKVEDRIVLVEVICPLCGALENGWGHNAFPLGDFRCCSGCNTHQVIPARIQKLTETNELLEAKLATKKMSCEKRKSHTRMGRDIKYYIKDLNREASNTPLAQRPHIVVQPEENRQKYEDELLKMCEEEDKQPKQQKTQKKKKEVKDRKPPKVVYINGVPVRLDALRK